MCVVCVSVHLRLCFLIFCSVIKYWIDKCGWDFDDKLLASLNAFIHGPLSRDGNLSLVKQLRTAVNKLLKRVSTRLA